MIAPSFARFVIRASPNESRRCCARFVEPWSCCAHRNSHQSHVFRIIRFASNLHPQALLAWKVFPLLPSPFCEPSQTLGQSLNVVHLPPPTSVLLRRLTCSRSSAWLSCRSFFSWYREIPAATANPERKEDTRTRRSPIVHHRFSRSSSVSSHDLPPSNPDGPKKDRRDRPFLRSLPGLLPSCPGSSGTSLSRVPFCRPEQTRTNPKVGTEGKETRRNAPTQLAMKLVKCVANAGSKARLQNTGVRSPGKEGG